MPQAGTSIIPIGSDESYGPAMRALTDGQKRFVIAMLETGGANVTRAAVMAGYGEIGAQQTGSRLQHQPSIQIAMREEAEKRLRAGAILGASVIIEIAADPSHKDRFKAAERLLGQAGLGIETVQRHIIEDHRKDNEIEDAIIMMAKRHGLDPAKLLGKKADVVDAEFTEVDEGSMAGLEDLA